MKITSETWSWITVGIVVSFAISLVSFMAWQFFALPHRSYIPFAGQCSESECYLQSRYFPHVPVSRGKFAIYRTWETVLTIQCGLVLALCAWDHLKNKSEQPKPKRRK